ncbi:hypothetical protein ANCCAN_04672 [Ancylostoma caninum]|uniref:Uncharacterized protein n=1 Tax=Ancylostoma caninum TaxID=29170 RepID=A0A368H1Y7_ANCCA|nr:hypothetical protein ANCCAN_04672 [Ancylostoma caninum]
MEDTKFEKVYPKEIQTDAVNQVYRRCRLTAYATKACSANYNACLMTRNADDCTREMKECSTGCVAINATTHCDFALNSFIEKLDRKKKPEEPGMPKPVPEKPKPEEPQEPGTITRATRVGGTLKPHTPESSLGDKASSKLSETSSSRGFLNDTFALVIILIVLLSVSVSCSASCCCTHPKLFPYCDAPPKPRKTNILLHKENTHTVPVNKKPGVCCSFCSRRTPIEQ